MLQLQTAEIVLEGLESSTDHKVQQPGKLRRAINVTTNKTGKLSKRRGYRRIAVSSDALGNDMEEVYVRVGQFDDELVLFGLDFLWAIGSKEGQLDGDVACIKRGPLSRGNADFLFVASSGEAR